MLPVGMMFRGPQCFKKHWFVELWGVHVDLIWPMAYITLSGKAITSHFLE